eukprot:jgi/Mesvir1/17282/Mv07688-RA.2
MSQPELPRGYSQEGMPLDAAATEPKRKILSLGEEVTAIITPVSICMMIVVALVRGLSDGDGTENGPTIGTLYYNENANSGDSKAKKFSGALINALIFVGAVIVLTFILFLCFKYKCSKAIWAYMGFAGFTLFFGFGGGLFAEICVALGFQLDLITFFIVLWNFSVMGVLAAFFWHSPVFLKQGYLVIVGAIVAYWFTNLAEWTTWLLLGAMAIYDLIAVLMPGGPLKLLVELAMERNEEIPALIYEARPTSSTQGVRVQDRRQQPTEGQGRGSGRGDARWQPPVPAQMLAAPHPAGAGQITVVDASGAAPAAHVRGHEGGLSQGAPGARSGAGRGSSSGRRDAAANGASPRPGDRMPAPAASQGMPEGPQDCGARHGEMGGVSSAHRPGGLDASNDRSRTPMSSAAHISTSRPSEDGDFPEQLSLRTARPRPSADSPAVDSPVVASPLATFPLLYRGTGHSNSRSPSPRPAESLRPVDSVRAVCCGVAPPRVSVDVDSVPDEAPLSQGGFMVQGIPLVTAEGQPRQGMPPHGQGGDLGGGWGGRPRAAMERGYLDAILNEEEGRPREAEPANVEELLGLPDSIKLGLGDFIFYSLLVGRAAKYDMLTVYVCYLGIIAGLGTCASWHGTM